MLRQPADDAVRLVEVLCLVQPQRFGGAEHVDDRQEHPDPLDAFLFADCGQQRHEGLARLLGVEEPGFLVIEELQIVGLAAHSVAERSSQLVLNLFLQVRQLFLGQRYLLFHLNND